VFLLPDNSIYFKLPSVKGLITYVLSVFLPMSVFPAEFPKRMEYIIAMEFENLLNSLFL